MTRLANEHGAINLAQGFTDEPPAYPLVWGAVAALLGGSDAGIRRLEQVTAAVLEMFSARGIPVSRAVADWLAEVPDVSEAALVQAALACRDATDFLRRVRR